jgi:hypothetical protein
MTAAEEAEELYKKLHPGAPVTTTTAAPTSPAPTDDAETTYRKLHPPPSPSDQEITSQGYAPRNLPPNVSQGDYWSAEGRKIGGELTRDAANVGTVFSDDVLFGIPGFTPGVGADYRAKVEAARADMPWAARTGVDTMAFLANKPFQALRLGLRGGQAAAAAARKIAPNLSPEALQQVARRVGDFVEGGSYVGGQSAGHGEDPDTVAADALGGGLFSTAFGGAFDAARATGPRVRSWFHGAPEGTPAEIAAGPPPGAPPYTPEQAMDANQLNLWRSQSRLTSPPNQAEVGNYAERVYGPDPANWPEALRDIHSAAGKEGGPSTAARIIGHSATQAGAAATNYLGLGFSPELAAFAHPALMSATEMALPALGYGGAVAPVRGALSDAFPALTGWRNAPNTPDWRIDQ